MRDDKRPIYGNDGTVVALCPKVEGPIEIEEIELVGKKHSRITISSLFSQIYNPSIANQRRGKRR